MITPEIARECLTQSGRHTTDEEVEKFLAAVKDGIPVMPVTFFCDFLTEWQSLYNEPCEERYQDEKKNRAELCERIRDVFLQIRKSNLLWRRIYRGLPVRKTPCPEHKGHWSGCPYDIADLPCKGACVVGGNTTGWLPEVGEPHD